MPYTLFQAYQVFYLSQYYKTKTYFNETGKQYDKREIYEIYLHNLAAGNEKTVSVPPKYFTKKKKCEFSSSFLNFKISNYSL